MAGIEKRGDYKPRSQREKEAYRLVLTAGSTGVLAVVTLVLAIVGFSSVIWPILLVLISVWCVMRFRRITGQR